MRPIGDLHVLKNHLLAIFDDCMIQFDLMGWLSTRHIQCVVVLQIQIQIEVHFPPICLDAISKFSICGRYIFGQAD